MRNGPRSLDSMMRDWRAFLEAADDVFAKLQKGAQKNDASQKWWGKLKQLRKDDPLLSYIHHARRIEKHGLTFSTQMSAPAIELVDRTYAIPQERRGKELLIDIGHPGKLVKTVLPTSVGLVPVVDDQYGDVFPVPKTHMGKPLTPTTIDDFAELALNTLEEIINEARDLLPPEQRTPWRDILTPGRT